MSWSNMLISKWNLAISMVHQTKALGVPWYRSLPRSISYGRSSMVLLVAVR